jgi:hypothetical protein
MSDIKGFERDLNKFADGLGIRLETVIKRISLEVFTGVVRKTPVDTGRARAGWVIGIERPLNSPNLSPAQKFTPAEAERYATTELAELREIGPFSTVFISNSLPYIEALEEGSSKQAPEGMVAVTLTEVSRNLKKIADEF